MISNTIIHEAVRFITLHGIFISLAMSAAQLVVRNKSEKNYIFTALFLSFFLLESFTLLYIYDYMNQFRIWTYLALSSFYLLGPSLFLLSRYTLSGSLPRKKLIALQYFPFILCIMFLTFTQPELPDFSQSPELLFADYPIIFFIGACGLFYVLFFLLMTGRSIYAEVEKESIIELLSKPMGSICLALYILFLLGVIFDFLMIFVTSPLTQLLAASTTPLASTILFLILFRYPDTYAAATQAGLRHKKRRSYLGETDIDTLSEALKRLIIEEELFRDEDLSLPDLSAKIDLTIHQLSELLNRHLKTNFSHYINKIRIEAACKELTDCPAKSILSVCFNVGFNSKSAFNRAFKEETGITPSDFRKKTSSNL